MHAARRFFAPRVVNLGPRRPTSIGGWGEGAGPLRAYLHNDAGNEWRTFVTVRQITYDGRTLRACSAFRQLAPRSAASLDVPDNWPRDPATFLVAEADGGERAFWWFAADKNAPMPTPQLTATVDDGNVTVTAGTLLRDLCLFADRLHPSAAAGDACVTLLPGESFTFHVDSPVPLDHDALVRPPVLRCVETRFSLPLKLYVMDFNRRTVMEHKTNRRRGFTLVELLVVIGIIALLISILLPSLNRAREAAKQTYCLANHRSIGQQLVMYLNDNQSRYPVSYFQGHAQLGGHIQLDFGLPEVYNNWEFMKNKGDPGMNFFGGLLRMNEALGKSLICPSSDFGEDGAANPAPLAPEQPITNYLINANFVNRKASMITSSSEYAVLQDNLKSFRNSYLRPRRRVAVAPQQPWGPPYADALTGPFTAGDSYFNWALTPATVPGASPYATYSNVHNGGGTFLMGDGHGEWRKHTDLTARIYALTGGTGVAGTSESTYDDDASQPLFYRSIFDTTRE